MEKSKLLSICIFSFLPVLFVLRAYYGYLKSISFGDEKLSIFMISKMKVEGVHSKLVLVARSIIGLSIIAYSIIGSLIIMIRLN
jgi:hypothetical protein